MVINNPLRPGSVTTDILADGAVTCAKTDFSACILTVGTSPKTNIYPSTPPNAASTTDGGLLFTNSAQTYPAGLVTEVTGEVLTLAINTTQIGSYVVGRSGGIFRLDSRTNTAFQIWLHPTTSGTLTQVLSIDAGTHLVTLAQPLPITSGGTGNTAPALVGGTNISIAGTWPNQTISVVTQPTFGGILITEGNSVSLGNSTTGHNTILTADTTDTVSGVTASALRVQELSVANLLALDESGNLGLAGTLKLGTVLGVTYGGTGTATPSLVAGSNVTITGTWPNQTIAVSTNPVVSGTDPYIGVNSTSGTEHKASVLFQQAGSNAWEIVQDIAQTNTLDLTFYNDATTHNVLVLNTNDTIAILSKLSSYNGDTLAGNGVGTLLKTGSTTGVSGPSTVDYITPPVTGLYRVHIYVRVTATGTGNISPTLVYEDAWALTTTDLTLLSLTSPTVGQVYSYSGFVYASNGETISLQTQSSGTSPTIDIAYIFERLS